MNGKPNKSGNSAKRRRRSAPEQFEIDDQKQQRS